MGNKKKMVVLTGAGMSAESGLKTFRDAGGLWEGHDVMEVASPMGWNNDPELVLDFYNQRRRQLKEAIPNKGHLGLAALEDHYDVHIITQNVDDLHERAGSTQVLHLHGELRKVRSTVNPGLVLDWEEDLNWGDTGEDGHQLRPHIVWFGEAVPLMTDAILITREADILVVIGTSMQVYPAAQLIHYCPSDTQLFFIDPNPNIQQEHFPGMTIYEETASEGVALLIKALVG
jgi:NAD-dependent deacetylase